MSSSSAFLLSGHHRFFLSFLSAAVIASGSWTTPVLGQQYSELWGEKGEKWDPANSILRDFTKVGYKEGAEPIPDWPVGVNVMDFGAVPNDVTVCNAQAFRDAIAACPDYHAVLVPVGRYTIMDTIKPERDHFVLRGEDMYGSVLFFPKYLNEIKIQEIGLGNKDRNTGIMDGFITMIGGTEKSIENLSFEFREQRKGGLWEHLGARPIQYGGGITNSWIRNVYLKNYDYGIGFSGTSNLSVINITMDGFIGRKSIVGSLDIPGFLALMGLLPHGSNSNLFHNINVLGAVMHPVDLNNAPRGNVFSKIRGETRTVSYHGGNSREQLYTDLDNFVAGVGDHPNRTYETYWGVDHPLPEEAYNSTRNHIFVGYGKDFGKKSTDTVWYEPAAYEELSPQNLYLAQMEFLGKPLPEGPPPPIPSPNGGDFFRIAPTDNKDISRPGLTIDGSFFKFDLSEIDVDAVAQARFRVNFSQFRNAPFEFGVWVVNNDNWSEETLTAENAPELISQLDVVRIEEGEENLTVEFDVTEFVRDQLVGGDGVVSLALRKNDGNGFLSIIRGRDGGMGPELIVERVATGVLGAPSAPKGVGSKALVGNILLNWDDNPESDVATYTVYRNSFDARKGEFRGYGASHAAGLTHSEFADIASNDWSVGMMDHNEVYKYKITAVDAHGHESPRSREFVAATLHPSNSPPAFRETASLPAATAGKEYSGSLTDAASDPESDPLYFMKVSGPDWLEVALDGKLSGTPDLTDVGSGEFTFQVTAIGGSQQKVVSMAVDAPAE